jgi:hypothetical protein
MYEIVVRIGDNEFVADTADSIVAASNHCSFYRLQGYHAFYRAALKRVA